MKKNKLYILSVLILIVHIADANKSTVIINEVQYQNNVTIKDSEDNTPDWIEIYNYGTESVELKGYQLSDDPDLEDCWEFPNLELLPGDYLLIFASGKNKVLENEIHTDFKLKQMNDPLFLLDDKGEILDRIEIQCIPANKSLGCFPDGSADKVLQMPTPGNSNNTSEIITIDFRPDTLIASHPGGFYDRDVQICLSRKHEKNKIVYTLNGDDPGYDSQEYIDLLNLEDISGNRNRFANLGDDGYKPDDLLSKANILRAVVYSEGCPASNEISNTYFISKKAAFDYNIPVVSIITDKDYLFDEEQGIYVKGLYKNYMQTGKAWEREAHIEIFDTLQNCVVDQKIGIRVHGRGSRPEPQKSLRLCARKEYGKESFDYQFFPQKNINKFSTLLLSAEKCFSPVTFIDELSHYLVKDINMDYQAWQISIVFINGEYWGIHHFREYFDTDYFESNHGYHALEYDIITHERGGGPTATMGDTEEYNRLVDYISSVDLTDDNNFKLLESMIDIENMMDYFITQIFIANTDFPDNNYKMWRPKTETAKWRWLLYDCEAGLHFLQSDKLLQYISFPDFLDDNPEWSVFLLQEMLKNQSFRHRFYIKFNWHLSHTFSTKTLLEATHVFEQNYSPYIFEHIYRWGKPVSFNKWLENINTIENFAFKRPDYIIKQMQQTFNNPFIVYPNPSIRQFKIDFYGDESKKKISIIDINQRVVFSDLTFNSLVHIVSSIEDGIYLLKIKTDVAVYTQHILIYK